MRSKSEPLRPAFAAQLSSVPVRNERSEVRRDEPASLRVAVSLVYPPWLASLAQALHLRRERSYELEGVGRRVYEGIDGRASVASLIDDLAEEHRLSFHEARVLVMTYLKTLAERGLIVLTMTDSTEPR
jgi:hypothetical protein